MTGLDQRSGRRPFLLATGCALAALLAGASVRAQQQQQSQPPVPAADTAVATTTNAALPDEPAATWNERIVVTADRGERAVREVPLQVTVVDPLEPGAELDFSASDLVSREVPSLNLQVANSSLAASPRDQSLNFRGVSGASVSHALLLVDGLPMLDPYNASAIWSKVPKDLIDRVEVVPGGGATAWGNLALSGVVNLITRAPVDSALAASARLAEHSTAGLTASYSDVGDEWTGWAAFDHLSTDGYLTGPENPRGDADAPEYREYDSLTANATHGLSASASLRARATGYREDRGEGTPIDFAQNDEWSASMSADLVSGTRTTALFQIYGRRLGLDDFTGALSADRNTVTPSAHIFDLSSDNLGLSAVWTRVGGQRRTLTAGADYQYISIDRSEDLEWNGLAFTQRYGLTGKQQLAGGFVDSHWELGARLSLQAAARFDAIRTHDGASMRTDLVTGALTEDQHLAANTEQTANPSLGFSFQATPTSRLRGAAYTGFRSPTPSELFVGNAPRNNRETAPNPDLEPETLIGGELGYDYSSSRRFNARVTGFWSETDGLIERVTLGRVGAAGGFIEPCGSVGRNGTCSQRRNIGKTRAQGVELDGEYRPQSHWRIDVAAVLLDAEVVENAAAPELVGNEIEQTPSERFTIGVSYADPRTISAALRGRMVGDRFAEVENENPLDAHTVVDLTLTRPLSDRLDIFGGAENLLDEEFAVNFGGGIYRYGLRRTFQLGVRYRSF